MTFLNDNAYQALRQRFSTPNIFLILDNASYEIRHSNFLRWLLDPKESHGQQDYFLRQLLVDLECEELFADGAITVARELDHIDLLIYNNSSVLVIENKTKTKDSDGQLSKYENIVNKRFTDHKKRFIYWTLEGEKPTDPRAKVWRSYSYRTFLKILNKKACDQEIDAKTKILIQDYVDALRLGLLPDDDDIRVAKDLLASHKDELREVFSALPNLPERYSETKPSDIKTIMFIQRNSSFVKGNGFFSEYEPFAAAFTKACNVAGFHVSPRGNKQTTYFKFVASVNDAGESIPYYFSFRFDDKKSVLTLKLGLHPEKEGNAKARQLILENIPRFHNSGVGIPIIRSGTKHVGILKCEIPFDPMSVPDNAIDNHISMMFDNKVKDFVSKLSMLLSSISRNG